MKRLLFFVFLLPLNLLAQSDFVHRDDKLAEIVISATRANWRIPVTFTNLKTSDISNLMVSPEIPAAIGLMPSVVMTSENGSSIGNQSFRIRGSDASRINVTLDGVPINDGESQSVFWANMPNLTASLQTMQVQRGVGTSANGAAAFGASVNMQSLQNNQNPYIQASRLYGSFNTNKYNIAFGSGHTKKGWFMDMQSTVGKTDGYIDNGNSQQVSVFLTTGYMIENRMIKVNLFHGQQKTGITWEGVPEIEYFAGNRTYNITKTDTDNYTQTHLHLHYIETITEKLKFNTTFYLTRGGGYYQQFREQDDLNRYIPNTNIYSDISRQRWLDNILVGTIANATYTSNKLRLDVGISANAFDNYHFGRIVEDESATIPIGYQWYHNIGKKTDIGSYIKTVYNVYNQWYIFGDIQLRTIRYRINGIDNDLVDIELDKRYTFFNPKVGTTFLISPAQRAYASFAVGRREPARADIKDALKRNTLKENLPSPETLYNLETGYEFQNARWTIGANYFYMYYIDQLINTGKRSDTGYALMENVKNSYRTGVELVIGLRASDKLQFNGNLTYSRNIIKNYVAYIDARDDNRLPLPQIVEYYRTSNIAFSPDWVAASDITYQIINGLYIGTNLKYVGKQYYDNTTSKERMLKAYLVNNAVITYNYKFKKVHTKLQFSINNLWNTDYISNAAVYRRYTAGIEDIGRSYFFPQPFRNYLIKFTVGSF
jgi:iron complex outermembrane receptor protein